MQIYDRRRTFGVNVEGCFNILSLTLNTRMNFAGILISDNSVSVLNNDLC